MFDCEGEEEWRQVEQVEALLKTLYLLTGTELDIFIITNDHDIYQRILKSLRKGSCTPPLSSTISQSRFVTEFISAVIYMRMVL